ncbi:hypothetical protein JOL79_08800 [Microbispora sp. RL4-1S]|uniref:Uncharacterized protein n=1 Tax=Microbispora oryzae TaxID=2806554 RepID=A0A941APP5_9ACTN|nr:hypothetical protein [Microbispora oryzae]MBP2703904.1 hypothetical protein [Microbispora oryzae]
MLILVSACRSELFPHTQRVDPDAVGEIRRIGKVLVGSDSESTWDGVTQVTKILAIDIGIPDKESVVSAAGKLLEKQGWAMVINKDPDSAWMESHKWDNLGIMIKGIGYYESHDGVDSIEEKAIKTARMQSDSQGIVILEVEPTGE